MNNGKIAIRYARALMMSAGESKSQDTVYKEICMLNRSLEQFPQLEHALSTPTISDEEKLKLLKVATGSKPCKETENFLTFVIRKNRDEYIPSIARMYEKLYRESKGMVVSTITSAIELPAPTLKAISKYIENTKHKKVELRTETNESLIGGFVLDVEDQRMDASIKGQLSKLYKYAGH